MSESHLAERKKNLEQTLKNDFDFKIVSDIPNIDYPLLLILDYSPESEDKLVSFAFSLLKYYQNSNNDFNRRFWMTEANSHDNSSNNPEWPNSHPPYKEFNYSNYHFYPFSIKVEGYNFLEIQSMRKLLRNLYHSIKF